jgi:hypothetical protein
MFATNVAIDPLRRRMIEDMSVRKLTAKTQHDDMQRVKDFAGFLGRSPDTAKSEEVAWLSAAFAVERRRHARDQRRPPAL